MSNWYTITAAGVKTNAVRPPCAPTKYSTNDAHLRNRQRSHQYRFSALTSLPMYRGATFMVILGFGALPTTHGSEQQAIRVARALLLVCCATNAMKVFEAELTMKLTLVDSS